MRAAHYCVLRSFFGINPKVRHAEQSELTHDRSGNNESVPIKNPLHDRFRYTGGGLSCSVAVPIQTPNQKFLPIPAGRNSGLSIRKISINVKIERYFFCSKTNEVAVSAVWCEGFSAHGRGAEPV